MKKNKKVSIVFAIIASLIVFYMVNRCVLITESLTGTFIDRLSVSLDTVFTVIAKNPFKLGLTKASLIAGFISMVVVWLVYLYFALGKKNYMPGIEHGSAKWGNKKDITNFIDKDPANNIILTATESLSMSNRMLRTKEDDYNRNKNVLVVGGSGSGKTRNFVKPNIMQMHSSYVITDPKGQLIHECGNMLAKNGYIIKVFDLINRDKTDYYNPFEYIQSPDDILKLINNIIVNTETPNNHRDFWVKSEIPFLEAIFAYIFYELPKEEQNINTAMKLIRLAEVKEEDEEYVSALDMLFEDLRRIDPNHFALKQYDIFKLGAGKTLKSILISVGVRLAAFNIPSISKIISRDTLELKEIGNRKTALFIILPDTDRSYNFIAAMMYQQLFDTLCYSADHEYNGQLPIHVRCIIEEFANIGQIPDFKILVATLRSRNISVNIILQNLSQIRSLYKDDWETITGNCDCLLFLGGMEQGTLDYISKMCGKTTIDNRNVNESKGQSGSYQLQYQVLGRDLITPDEVGRIKGHECILIVSRNRPYLSKKFDLTKHQNYKLLSDADKANWFDVSNRY